MEKYWENAITFDEYMQVAKQRAENPAEGDHYKDYYELGLQRMERTLKTFKVNPEMLEKLKSKNFDGKVLIISMSIPIIASLLETILKLLP